MLQRDIVSQVITASAKAVSINYCCPNACVQHCDSDRALPVDIGPRDSDNKHSSYQLTVRATAREWTSCTKHLRDRTISVVLLLRNVSSRVHLCIDKKRSVPSENQGGASTPTARKGVNYGKIEILRKRTQSVCSSRSSGPRRRLGLTRPENEHPSLDSDSRSSECKNTQNVNKLHSAVNLRRKKASSVVGCDRVPVHLGEVAQ